MSNTIDTVTFDAEDGTGEVVTATVQFNNDDYADVCMAEGESFKLYSCEVGYQLQDGDQVIAVTYRDEKYPHIWRAFDVDCERDADNPVSALLKVARNVI